MASFLVGIATHWLDRRRWLHWCAAALVGCVGCSQTSLTTLPSPSAPIPAMPRPAAAPVVAKIMDPAPARTAPPSVKQVQHTELPAPKVLPEPVAVTQGKPLPINLDTVMRLAGDQ